MFATELFVVVVVHGVLSDQGSALVHSPIISLVARVMFENSEPVAIHVRVSVAQVVVIVAHVSAKFTLEAFVTEVEGFEVLVIIVNQSSLLRVY